MSVILFRRPVDRFTRPVERRGLQRKPQLLNQKEEDRGHQGEEENEDGTCRFAGGGDHGDIPFKGCMSGGAGA
jgi:hypothetical protein